MQQIKYDTKGLLNTGLNGKVFLYRGSIWFNIMKQRDLNKWSLWIGGLSIKVIPIQGRSLRIELVIVINSQNVKNLDFHTYFFWHPLLILTPALADFTVVIAFKKTHCMTDE